MLTALGGSDGAEKREKKKFPSGREMAHSTNNLEANSICDSRIPHPTCSVFSDQRIVGAGSKEERWRATQERQNVNWSRREEAFYLVSYIEPWGGSKTL